MKIDQATIENFDELYDLGQSAPEMRVSGTEPFMTEEEFMWAIKNSNGVFLKARDNEKIVGFIYADIKDHGKPLKSIYACIVFVVVLSEYRRTGIATKLYEKCKERLKNMGCTNLYVWANAEGNGEIIKFMEKQGFMKGHKYIWMDKKV